MRSFALLLLFFALSLTATAQPRLPLVLSAKGQSLSLGTSAAASDTLLTPDCTLEEAAVWQWRNTIPNGGYLRGAADPIHRYPTSPSSQVTKTASVYSWLLRTLVDSLPARKPYFSSLAQGSTGVWDNPTTTSDVNWAPGGALSNTAATKLAKLLARAETGGVCHYQILMGMETDAANLYDKRTLLGLYPNGMVVDSLIDPATGVLSTNVVYSSAAADNMYTVARNWMLHALTEAQCVVVTEPAWWTAYPTTRMRGSMAMSLLLPRVVADLQAEGKNVQYIRLGNMGCQWDGIHRTWQGQRLVADKIARLIVARERL